MAYLVHEVRAYFRVDCGEYVVEEIHISLGRSYRQHAARESSRSVQSGSCGSRVAGATHRCDGQYRVGKDLLGKTGRELRTCSKYVSCKG